MLSQKFKRLLHHRKYFCRSCCTDTKSIDEIYSKRRSYFYCIDKDGRLYLEETSPKTFITSFKSVKFLDFFWRQIRDNNSNIHKGYPWISDCGNELNFIKSEASTPIIYFDLVTKIDDDSGHYRTYENSLDHNQHNKREYYLQFAGSLLHPLNPQQLTCDIESGRLYHKISNAENCNNTSIKCTQKYGAIGSHLLLTMSNVFQIVQMSDKEKSVYDFVWDGMEFDIPVTSALT